MSATLLQKAIATKTAGGAHRKTASQILERQELSVAWAMGEVTLTQVATAIGIPANQGGTVYAFLALGLRDSFNSHEGRK